MASDILHDINEIFLHHFPGKRKGEEDTITPDESRFQKQSSVLSPEFDIDKTKLFLGFPERLENCGLSDRLDKLLWEHYDIFKHMDSLDLNCFQPHCQ